jgi:hypothetical protein
MRCALLHLLRRAALSRPVYNDSFSLTAGRSIASAGASDEISTSRIWRRAIVDWPADASDSDARDWGWQPVYDAVAHHNI